MVRLDNDTRREWHVYSLASDNGSDKSLSPVGLFYWHCSQEYCSNHKRRHANEYDNTGLNPTNGQPRNNGGYGSGNCRGDCLSRCEQDCLVS